MQWSGSMEQSQLSADPGSAGLMLVRNQKFLTLKRMVKFGERKQLMGNSGWRKTKNKGMGWERTVNSSEHRGSGVRRTFCSNRNVLYLHHPVLEPSATWGHCTFDVVRGAEELNYLFYLILTS